MSRATNNAGAPRHGFKLKLAFLVLLWPLTVKSELAVDEIYSPRVTAGDLEIGVVGAFLDSEGSEIDNLNAIKRPGGAYSLEEYEIELIGNFFQDTESAAGLFIELSKEHGQKAGGVTLGSLYERQLYAHYSILTNLLVSRSFGEDDEQLEPTGSLQFAYTKSDTFQPGLEYYGAENNHLMGPAILAEFRMGSSILELQAGVAFGLTTDSDDMIYRWELEIEL